MIVRTISDLIRIAVGILMNQRYQQHIQQIDQTQAGNIDPLMSRIV